MSTMFVGMFCDRSLGLGNMIPAVRKSREREHSVGMIRVGQFFSGLLPFLYGFPLMF